MRIPGAALLITLGLLVLWIATTGKLDKLAGAWDYVRSPDNPLGKDVTAPLKTAQLSTADRVASSILHVERYHMSSMMDTLLPNATAPGGMI